MLKKWFSNLFVGRSAFLTVVLVCTLLCQVSCLSSCQELNERRNRAEADIDNICKKIPIPNDFVAVSSDKSLDIEKVVISRRFKSNASCEVAREHFFAHFIHEGWNQEQMKVEQSRGGMESLDFIFRNNDYVVWVACQNDVNDKTEKQIVVSCSWGLR